MQKFGAILVILMLCALAYRILLQYLNEMAWPAAVQRMKVQGTSGAKTDPFTVTPGWTFLSQSPAYWGIENTFHCLVHLPVYVWRYIALICYYLPRDAQRRYFRGETVSDKVLWDFITDTVLMLLCDIDSSGEILTYRCEGCSKGIFTNGTRDDCMIDGTTLVLKMKNGIVLSAKTKDGPVLDGKWITRNEILADALARTEALWGHTLIHYSGERSAASIARLEVDILKPCALHTHSIHDALLHSPVGPLTKTWTPFTSWLNRMEDVANGLEGMMPHQLHRIKDPRKFKVFNYMLRAHGVVSKILLKYNLAQEINVDDFFALVIMHDLDHITGYRAFWNEVPLRPSNETSFFMFFVSMYQNCVQQQLWTPPIINPFWSMYIKDSTQPFFQELYRGLEKIDKDLAGLARFSITF
jgi:hypothetical protein